MMMTVAKKKQKGGFGEYGDFVVYLDVNVVCICVCCSAARSVRVPRSDGPLTEGESVPSIHRRGDTLLLCSLVRPLGALIEWVSRRR